MILQALVLRGDLPLEESLTIPEVPSALAYAAPMLASLKHGLCICLREKEISAL